MSGPASHETHRPRGDLRLVLAGLCLLAPFVAMLWVSSYASEDPPLGGFPFFYWYQLAWIFITVTLTLVAYRLVILVERDHRARREAARQAGRTQSPVGGEQR